MHTQKNKEIPWAFEWFLQLSLQPKIHVYLVTCELCDPLFPPSSQKLQDKKTTQPWWPLLPSYYYAAVCDTDMAGGEHHHRWPYYANMTDDLPPTSWLAHKNTSNIVHHLMTWKYSSLTTCMVPSIKDCCGCHRTTWPIYMYSRLGGTLLANLTHPIQPKMTYIWHA